MKLQLDAVTEDMRQLQRDATERANELQEQQRERADDAERALDRSLNALREQIDGQLAALQGAMFAELLQQVDAERQARNDQRNGDLQQLGTPQPSGWGRSTHSALWAGVVVGPAARVSACC